MIKWKSEKLLMIFAVLSAIECNSITPLTTSLRLPRAIIPQHYDINLETAVHDGILLRDYGGEVKIDLEVAQVTNYVVLHHRGLNIVNLKLIDISTSSELLIHPHTYDNVTEFLTIQSNDTLNVGDNLRLEIEFSGKLQTGTSGFYRSQYQVKGEIFPRYLAATQFEATHARSAFPCFDEPEWRATFKLSINHGSNYTAISNMEGTPTINTNGTTTTDFPTTSVSMPTYLLAFVVSDLTYRTRSFSNTYKQRVYSVTNLNSHLTQSLYYSIEYLNLLQTFVNGFTYKLPKLYSVAVPDHGSAMENYGLILYKEQYLVLEDNPHPIEVYDVVGTITHELTHQFFGNVVTCKWWDQIWLNEGFATWGEFLLPELYPVSKDMQFHHLFNIKKTQNAFRSDSLQSTRPMTYETSTNAEISARFDRIAYDKAGAVIRMFQYAVGDINFKAALYRYLSDNEHESVTSNELLDAFEAVVATTYNFTEAFRTWEEQKGYPVITVVYDSSASSFKITQKRYVSAFEEVDPNDANLKWHIPLSFATKINPNFDNEYFTTFFSKNEDEKIISTSGLTSSDWFIFNIQQHGYYRVNYDTDNWNNLIRVLNSGDYKSIHVLNRAQIVDDALTMAFDGYLSYDIAFSIASYLVRETEYFPWYSASIVFDKLDYMLKGTPNHDKFRKFVHYLIQGLYVNQGLVHNPSDTDNTIIQQLARELAIDWSCRLGNKECLDHAYQELKSNDEIYPPLQISFYCNGLKDSNRSVEFMKLYYRMLDSDFQTERLRIIDGLLCSSNEMALRNLLEAMLEPRTAFFRTHERRRAFNNIVAKSEVGLKVLVEFIRSYHNDTRILMGEGFIDGLLVAASNRLTTSADILTLSEIVTFLENDPTYPLKENTKSDIAKNIAKSEQWRSTQRVQDIGVFVNDFLTAKWRLPSNSRPLQYEIQLDARNVQTGALPYSGSVIIIAEITEETDFIVLHSKNQVFENVQVTNSIGIAIPVRFHTFQTEVDQMTIYLDQSLPVGTGIRIYATYSTQLLDYIDGFYRDSYNGSDGAVKYLATTQFQAVEARRVFPCYDEPGLKAVFKVSITHDASYNAVANMPSYLIDNNPDGTKTTHFNNTPPMSSYLNAFLVSDFEVLTNEATKLSNETLQGIWTRPGETQKAQYGLDNSVKILNALQDFVGMEYNLPKLDSGAIPGKGGGMENWGFILYREAALMYEDDISHSLMNRGVRLIAHEIVHLFFGDLVTGEWWNYLWLNEGFATDLMYSILDTIYPEWHMKEFFNRNIMIPYAFVTDASSSTRSLSSELITTNDINDSFDDIAYDKAACFLRMLGYSLGHDIWRESLNLYLNQNKYKPVNSQHLINAVKDTLSTNGITFTDFERFFKTWEDQEGVPLVTVVFNPTTSKFVLKQERFFEKKTSSSDASSWYIPTNFATELNPNFDNITVTHYMKNGDVETLIDAPAGFNNSMWYLFNKQQIGYYRINYDAANWNALTRFLHSDEFEKMHVVNRMHLIDNAFVFAHGNYLDYKVPYDISTYLINETNFFTWDLFNDNIKLLQNVFGPRDSTLNRLIYFMSKNFYAQYKLRPTNIIPPEDMPIRYGRELAYLIACNAGNEDCLADTLILGALDATDFRSIPRGLEHPVLCSYFKQSTKTDEWRNVYNRMNKLQQNMDYTLKTNFINALACTNNEDRLYELLQSSIATNNVNYTQSDRRNVFTAVLNNEKGLEAAIKLLNIHGASNAPVDLYGWSWQRILLDMADSIYTESDQLTFKQFLGSFVHDDVTPDHLDRAATASGHNLEDQNASQNVRQMQLIHEILDRVFGETTTTTRSSSTQGTTPSTTTPASGCSLKISFILLGVTILITKIFF